MTCDGGLSKQMTEEGNERQRRTRVDREGESQREREREREREGEERERERERGLRRNTKLLRKISAIAR